MGWRGQPALVVGDDLVHVAGAKRVEHRLPPGSLDSRVRRRQVVVDEHPDRDFAPQSARQFHAIGPLALDADLQPGWSLLMRQYTATVLVLVIDRESHGWAGAMNVVGRSGSWCRAS